MNWIKEIIKSIIAASAINLITANLREFNSIKLIVSASIFIFFFGQLLKRATNNREMMLIKILRELGDILVNISIPILVIGSILINPTQQNETVNSQRREQMNQKTIEQTV
ncbi:MAG: hypothetical protein MRERV_13c046 [Mycoplasmataceae bacterium RV_VA103A]|nr:MAG: hypothetical protein MRERV_13c046 [Mycoplasmataceae bacterium RV_VA103A]